MRKSLLCLCIFISYFCHAQNNDNISLSGYIIGNTGEPIPYVTITNVTENKGAASDSEGFFFIRFNKQDTLELSAVGFDSHKLYFGDTAIANNYDLTIQLSEKTYQLENVTVIAYKDEVAFKKAFLALGKEDLPQETPKIVIPGSYDGPKIEKRPSATSPISFIYDRFSRRARYEREAKEAEQAYEYQKKLSKKYNRDLVGKITGLKNEDLDEFMMFCRLEDEFIESSSEYDIILAVNRCYHDFKKQ